MIRQDDLSKVLLFGLLFVNTSAALAEGESQIKKTSDRPNIILIMADDVGYECFGCYGSKQYSTPNIDRMARQGMRFNHCYSQPLCTPTRVKLMTGLSNARNYSAFSILNRDQQTIGHYFQAAGYETLVAGKWQLLGADHYPERFRLKGTWPRAAGFDHHCLWQVDRLGSRFWKPLLSVDGETREFGEDDYGPEVVTKYITDFMTKGRKQNKPFFIYYPMILVHSPFLPTPDSKSRGSKNKQRNFEDMVAYMDKLVGRITKQTEELGIAEQTLILFTGDNGTHKSLISTLNGRTIKGGKGSTTDAGTREPLVAYWPGVIPAGKTNDDLVDASDFLPTLAEAAGARIPDGLDGQTFFPQLRGEIGKPRQWMYCFYCPRPERTKPVRFVRDQRWKLYGDGRFFDVANDVNEKRAIENLDSIAGAAEAKRKLVVAIDSMPAEGQRLLKFSSGPK
jgi:arylsulfatase A